MAGSLDGLQRRINEITVSKWLFANVITKRVMTIGTNNQEEADQ